MARLIPADKGTHFVVGAACAVVLLMLGPLMAAAGCVAAAVGREVYGWWRREWRMSPADIKEAAMDIVATLGGGAVVLAGAAIGWASCS